MVNVKVYGNRSVWGERRSEISDAVHAALVSAWGIPEDKRFHRFLLLDDGDLVAPRSEAYLILEIICFSGRSPAAKHALVRTLYDDVTGALGLSPDDLEIVILESPRENWGIRGLPADELELTYRVEV